MGRAIELGLPLQVALAANFYFRPQVEERRLLTDLCELLLGRSLHNGMAVDAGQPTACVGARRPIGLDAPLVASEAGFILHLGRFA